MCSGRLWISKRLMIRSIGMICGARGKLLNAVQSFYVDCRACVRRQMM